MGRLIRSQLYVILRSRGALILLAVCLVFCWLLMNDGGDAIRDMRDLNDHIQRSAKNGVDYMAMVRNHAEQRGDEELREIRDKELLISILRRRQVIAVPGLTAGGMLLLLFLLPGAALTPGLGKSRGMGRELQTDGRTKPLLARMLGSWIFCFLLSTGMFLITLYRWSDPGAAATEQLLRGWVIVEFYVLAGVCYSYFMHTFFRHAAVAASVMILAEVLLHEVIPGLYLFQPFMMIPYYNSSAYLNTTSLLGAECPPGTFLWYCAVCLIYAVVCTFLAVLIFRRREIR